MTFDDMWKSLEEKDTTGKYKQAREMADLNIEQLEYAYNSGYADARSKYERPQGKWIDTDSEWLDYKCDKCGWRSTREHNFCPNCGADMRGGTNCIN